MLAVAAIFRKLKIDSPGDTHCVVKVDVPQEQHGCGDETQDCVRGCVVRRPSRRQSSRASNCFATFIASWTSSRR